MLRLSDGQVESLWDDVLPGEVRELPEDLAALDVLLGDPELLAPIASGWREEAVSWGRPSISMEVYVRLMVVKQRTGWGYETLVREVSDSLHLRRFCLIALGERVPHESTVRKLTRRLGAVVVDELTRCVIAKAQRETRFKARAVRIDSTVVEADVRYPSDAALSLDGARTLARQARKLTALIGADAGRVRDRSRALGRRLRSISRTMARRTGERKAQVLALTGSSCRHPPSSATRTRASCSPTRPESSTGSGCDRERSRSMAGSSSDPPPKLSTSSRPSGCSSRAASNPAREGRSDGSAATAQERRAGSATSSAVTDCGDPA